MERPPFLPGHGHRDARHRCSRKRRAGGGFGSDEAPSKNGGSINRRNARLALTLTCTCRAGEVLQRRGVDEELRRRSVG